MTKNRRRVLAALLVTGIGLAINQGVYVYSQPEQIKIVDQVPLAVVVDAGNQNQRKINQSDLWQEINQGDTLYSGDTLRTSEESRLLVSFLNSNKVFTIEPDSMLVMQLDQGKIELDVIDGNIFQQAQQASLKIDLKALKEVARAEADNSGGSPENLNPDQVHIVDSQSKNESDEMALNSEATANTNLKNPEISVLPKLEVVQPEKDKDCVVDASHPEPCAFEIKDTTPNEITDLWLGLSRKKLKKVGTLKDGELRLVVPLGEGDYFWQFQSHDNAGAKVRETDLQMLKVTGVFPSRLLRPLNKSILKLKSTEARVDFEWQNSPQLRESVVIEIFAEGDLKRPVLSETISQGQHWQAPSLTSGSYFWTVKSQSLANPQLYLKSPLFQFTVLAKEKYSAPLVWDEKTETQQFFTGEQPILNIGWKVMGTYPIRNYKIQLMDSAQSLNETQVVNDLYLVKKIKRSGSIKVYVEGYDEDGEKVSTLGPRVFEVQPMPLLPSVHLSGLKGGMLDANDVGEIEVAWEPVAKASAYSWQLIGKEGKVLEDSENYETSKKLDSLLPGVYRLQVQAIDRWGRRGERHPAAQIVVPMPQNLVAPKIKKVEVQ